MTSARSGGQEPVLPSPWLSANNRASPGVAVHRAGSAEQGQGEVLPIAPPLPTSKGQQLQLQATRLMPGSQSRGPASQQMLRPKAHTSGPGEGPVPSTLVGGQGHVAEGGLLCGRRWALCIPTPIWAAGEACLKRVPMPTQLVPGNLPTPGQPAPSWHSQVCEIIQGLVRSEHVQQPDHLGRRPEHQVGWDMVEGIGGAQAYP